MFIKQDHDHNFGARENDNIKLWIITRQNVGFAVPFQVPCYVAACVPNYGSALVHVKSGHLDPVLKFFTTRLQLEIRVDLLSIDFPISQVVAQYSFPCELRFKRLMGNLMEFMHCWRHFSHLLPYKGSRMTNTKFGPLLFMNLYTIK